MSAILQTLPAQLTFAILDASCDGGTRALAFTRMIQLSGTIPHVRHQ